MQGMDADHERELAALRARAYGPNADIADDPAAVDRLRELEDRERARPVAVESVVDAPADARTEPAVSTPEDAAVADEMPTARRPLLRSRRSVWIAALAVAGLVAVTSGVTAAGVTFTTVDRTAGIAQTDALTPDPDLELGSAGYLGFDPTQVRGYADYYGLTVFAGVTQIDSEGNQAECLVVNETEELRDISSARSSSIAVRLGSCGAGAFPASVEFIVSTSFPEPFRARYPVGTAVQFVLDGDDVGVFTAAG